MMYRVDMVQTVIEETSIYIEANNEDEAAEKALEENARDGTTVQWDFCDAKDDPEVIAVEAVKWWPIEFVATAPL